MQTNDIRNILNLINTVQSSKKSYIIEFQQINGYTDVNADISLYESKLEDKPIGLDHWSDDDLLHLMFNYDKNLSVPTIAKLMKKPAYEIQKALDHFYPSRSTRANINTFSDEQLKTIANDFESGMATAELEKKYNVAYQTIRSKLSRQFPNFRTLDKNRRDTIGRQPLSPADIETARELRNAGMSYAQIANELGRKNSESIRRAIRDPQKPFDTAEKKLQLIAADFATGRSYNEMQGTYETSASNIAYHLENLANYNQLVKLRKDNLKRLRNNLPVKVYSPQLISPTLPPYKDEVPQKPEPNTEPVAQQTVTTSSEKPNDVSLKLTPTTLTKKDVVKMGKDYAKGITLADFKSKYKVNLRDVLNKIKKLPNYTELKNARDAAYERMTPEDIRIAKRMRKQGKKYTEIANKLKKFPYQVKRALQKAMMEQIANKFASGVSIETIAKRVNVRSDILLEHLKQLPDWLIYKQEHLFNKKVDQIINENFTKITSKYRDY